jgi:uncharacterized RmlC-like cupin family protein
MLGACDMEAKKERGVQKLWRSDAGIIADKGVAYKDLLRTSRVGTMSISAWCIMTRIWRASPNTGNCSDSGLIWR